MEKKTLAPTSAALWIVGSLLACIRKAVFFWHNSAGRELGWRVCVVQKKKCEQRVDYTSDNKLTRRMVIKTQHRECSWSTPTNGLSRLCCDSLSNHKAQERPTRLEVSLLILGYQGDEWSPTNILGYHRHISVYKNIFFLYILVVVYWCHCRVPTEWTVTWQQHRVREDEAARSTVNWNWLTILFNYWTC